MNQQESLDDLYVQIKGLENEIDSLHYKNKVLSKQIDECGNKRALRAVNLVQYDWKAEKMLHRRVIKRVREDVKNLTNSLADDFFMPVALKNQRLFSSHKKEMERLFNKMLFSAHGEMARYLDSAARELEHQFKKKSKWRALFNWIATKNKGRKKDELL